MPVISLVGAAWCFARDISVPTCSSSSSVTSMFSVSNPELSDTAKSVVSDARISPEVLQYDLCAARWSRARIHHHGHVSNTTVHHGYTSAWVAPAWVSCQPLRQRPHHAFLCSRASDGGTALQTLSADPNDKGVLVDESPSTLAKA